MAVYATARLKPCATNHPLGDVKPDLKPVAKEVFKKNRSI